MEEEKRKVLSDKIDQLIYSNYRTMEPSEELKQAAEYLMKEAKGYLNVDSDKERLVSIAYFADDIVPRLCKVFQGQEKVLFFNLLAIEFLADMLVFREYKDIESFEYVISKYLRIQEDDEENVGFAHFFNWVFSQYKENHRYDNTRHMSKAMAGSAFLLMHEWTHTQTDMIEKVMPLLDSTEEVKQCYTDDQGKENLRIKTEICCDFNALELCAGSKLERLFGLSRQEFLGVSIIASFIPALYKELKKAFWVNSTHKEELTKEIQDSLLSRVFAICILVRKAELSTNMFFEDQDIQTAMNECTLLSEWLRMHSKYLDEHFMKRVDSYNALPTEVQEQSNGYEYHRILWSIFA